MSTENQGDTPDQQVDQATETVTDSFEAILNDFGNSLGTQTAQQAPEQAQVASKEAPEPVQATPDSKKEEATPAESALSPLLAARAKSDRELRAKLATQTTDSENAVANAEAALIQKLIDDPQGFIAAHGEKLADHVGALALNFYRADLGDDAPDDLKAQVGENRQSRFEADINKRFAQLEYEKQEATVIAELTVIKQQYEGFMASVPKELPYFAAEVANDPTEAYIAMATVADEMRKQTGQYPTASEVTNVIETQLTELAARYAAVKTTTTPNVETPQTETVENEETITLSTDQSGGSAKPALIGEEAHFNDVLKDFENMF